MREASEVPLMGVKGRAKVVINGNEIAAKSPLRRDAEMGLVRRCLHVKLVTSFLICVYFALSLLPILVFLQDTFQRMRSPSFSYYSD